MKTVTEVEKDTLFRESNPCKSESVFSHPKIITKKYKNLIGTLTKQVCYKCVVQWKIKSNYFIPAACVALWSPFGADDATGAGAMFVTCPPVGTAVDTDPDGARVIGMLTGDLLGTSGL